MRPPLGAHRHRHGEVLRRVAVVLSVVLVLSVFLAVVVVVQEELLATMVAWTPVLHDADLAEAIVYGILERGRLMLLNGLSLPHPTPRSRR